MSYTNLKHVFGIKIGKVLLEIYTHEEVAVRSVLFQTQQVVSECSLKRHALSRPRSKTLARRRDWRREKERREERNDGVTLQLSERMGPF